MPKNITIAHPVTIDGVPRKPGEVVSVADVTASRLVGAGYARITPAPANVPTNEDPFPQYVSTAELLASLPSAIIPVATSGSGFHAITANTSSGTGRMPYLLNRAVTDLVAGFTNAFSVGQVDTDGATDVVIAAAVEVGGQVYPVTFQGRRQVTISPTAVVYHDPLPVDLPAGTFVFYRTFIVSGTWYTRSSAQAAGAGGWTVTTDLTGSGSAAIPDSTTFAAIPGPSVVLGRTADADRRSLLRVGDSVAFGQGDGITGSQSLNAAVNRLGRGGWVGRVAAALGLGEVNIAIPGDRGNSFVNLLNRRLRMRMADRSSTAILGYGRNDLSLGQTLAQVQATILAAAALTTARGMWTLVPTVTPITTSTDGWMTAGNQSGVASTATTNAYNAWLRAGAPVTIDGNGAVTPVTAGTTDAVLTAVYDGSGAQVGLASGIGHPFGGVIDPAANVEFGAVPRWKAAINVRTVADGAASATSQIITSATAAFTTDDIGRMLTLAGAGASGALFTGLIKAINSATSVTVAATTGTAVSGATLVIGEPYTVDGTHPSTQGHTVMANAVPSAAVR